ncbi:MAG: cytochrome c family protein [Sphingomonadales bacterium]
MTLPKVIFSILGAAFIFGAAGTASAGDAEAGKTVFRKCTMCHSPEEGINKIGPSLFGVVGRTPGGIEGFRYSKAMSAFGEDGKVWTEGLINEYLLAPRTLIPGNRMGFPGLRDETQRDDVIAYLKTLSNE